MSKGRKLELTFDSLGEGWSVDEVCDTCGENRSDCICKKSPSVLPPSQHRLVFKRQKRRGKWVTLAGEFHIERYEARELLKRLKKTLGCGGTFKEGWMEFQGAREEEVRASLVKEGFATR